MELRDYLRLARRHWLIIVGTVVVAVGLAAAFTAQATPMYASNARVFVSTTPSSSSDAYQGSLFSEQRVSSYADMANGLELASRVIDRLDLDLSPTELSAKIDASVVPDTVLLQTTVTDASPAQAQRINKAVVQELQDFVAELETPPGKTTPLLKATVVDPPRMPESPVSPKPLRNLGLAFVLGLLLGFGLAVVRELLDNSVKRLDDVAELEDVPMLSSMPFDNDVHKHPLISTLPSHAPRVEAFRVLRTNLQFIDVDAASKAFVVTSSVPAEGKSTTAVNTALALAQAGQNVLLVDGDMRRPQIAEMLGLENSVGLTTLLVGQIHLDDALQKHSYSGLHVLTSGVLPPNPAELLQSRAMKDLLQELRHRYDVIVIDAPPLLPVTDAALLAAETDGAVLVIKHSKTTREQVAGATERLASVDAKALGVVFNMVPRRRGVTGAYGYGYGYGYGYAPDERALDRADPRRADSRGRRKRSSV